MLPVCVSSQECRQFGKASLDLNPLHLSELYARQTPFGKPIVFGVLGVLILLSRLHNRPQRRAVRITAQFLNPLYCDNVYPVHCVEDLPEKTLVEIREGEQCLLRVKVRWTSEPHAIQPRARSVSAPTRLEAAARSAAELKNNFVLVDQSYAPEETQVVAMAQRYGLPEKGVDEATLISLLWASYLIGMEIPGRQALFSELDLQFASNPSNSGPDTPRFDARVSDFDDRFNLVLVAATLSQPGGLTCVGRFKAFYREMLSLETIEPSRCSHILAGKLALVVGASRGLGAALTQCLVARGCTVMAIYSQVSEGLDQLRKCLGDRSGRLLARQGDASDSVFLESLRQQVEDSGTGLDFLFCNACPALRSASIHPDNLKRIQMMLSDSFALVSGPMAHLLPELNRSQGHCVVVSTAAVTDLQREWPHYIAAKFAIEGFVQVAALQFTQCQFTIVRPPRLLTSLSESPLGREHARSPLEFAETLLTNLLDHEAEPGVRWVFP